MAGVFHLHGGNGNKEVQLRVTGAADALPGLLNGAAADFDGSRQGGPHHGGDGLVGELVRLRGPNGRQFDHIQFDAVQGTSDFQLLFEGEALRGALAGLSERHIDDFDGVHNVKLLVAEIILCKILFCAIQFPNHKTCHYYITFVKKVKRKEKRAGLATGSR